MQIRSVMTIDDDKVIRKITKIALEGVAHWQVTAVESGSSALISLQVAVPDVILLDMMMPEMDGPMTFKAIRQLPQACHVPVIFMTAKVQSHETERYIQMGAVGVIKKPFDPIDLPNEIQRLVDSKS